MNSKPAEYLIKSTMISTDYREKIIQDTLQIYLKNPDHKALVEDSPLVNWGRKVVKDGRWWYGCELHKDNPVALEISLSRRLREVIDLYHSIEKNGYNGSIISIYFDSEGNVKLYDGYHRLSILQFLDLRVNLNCRISYYDPSPKRRGDFPLRKILQEIHSGPNTYQPVDDPRVSDFVCWRPDSPKRLEMILPYIVGKTVLDIGCAEGYFARELAWRDFRVTALDYDPKKLAVARYLSIINNLALEYVMDPWQKHFNQGASYDTILILSVLHHAMLNRGPESLGDLKVLEGKCQKVIIELPLSASDVSWTDKRGSYHFDSVEELSAVLEENTGMDSEVIMFGRRPIFILEGFRE